MLPGFLSSPVISTMSAQKKISFPLGFLSVRIHFLIMVCLMHCPRVTLFLSGSIVSSMPSILPLRHAWPVLHTRVSWGAFHFQIPNCLLVWVLGHLQQKWILVFRIKEMSSEEYCIAQRIYERTRESGSVWVTQLGKVCTTSLQGNCSHLCQALNTKLCITTSTALGIWSWGECYYL